MTRENAAEKAKRYLGEARVVVTLVSDREVRARVRGDGAVYEVTWQGGRWSCDCPALTDQCAHCRAVRMVTAPDLERG